MRAIWPIALLLILAPAAIAAPAPILESHGVSVRAAHIGTCPPPGEWDTPCAFDDMFVPTKALPVHAGALVRLNTRVRARRVSVYVDCGTRRLRARGERVWTFRVRRADCTSASFYVVRRDRSRAAYTFSLREHVHATADY
jgi:hypothetical protein